jgi:type I restriction enzyme R subunit
MTITSAEYFEALRAARDFLRHVCGYECLHHDDEAFRNERVNETETILVARLEQRLRLLNPGLSESEVRRASRQLTRPEHADLALAQKQAHELLTQSAATESVRYFDFEQPANNNFLLVENFRLAGAPSPHTCDLAIFVNGIPLALVAVGRSNSKEGILHAANRLAQLQAAGPSLFHTAQILLSVQKNFSGVAAPGARPEAFAPWEDPFPRTWEEIRGALRQIPQRESELPAAQDIALAGVLSPSALLDLFKNFLVHEYGEHGLAPRLAWSHQYHAVRQACAQLAKHSAPRPGIVWHPGSSGKTYTLAWLAAQIRLLPAYGRHHLVIVTDCEKQRLLVRGVFQQRHLALPFAALEAEAFNKLVRRTRPETVLVTREILLQATQALSDSPAMPPAAPLLFLFDETTNGAALEQAQRAFPYGVMIGCTAHPLKRETASCELWHFFSNAHAQRRGHLLPARLEARLPRLHQRLANASSDFVAGNIPAELNERRITSLAEDLHEHFTQEIRDHHGKAIVLAANAQEAAWYFQALETQLSGQVAVLVPKPPGHKHELVELYRRFAKDENLLPRWRDPKDELVLLIIAGPLFEDLRAPHVYAVYADRELRGYELLHALALVQMPNAESKTFGLLVDYFGVSQYVETELAQFDFHQAEPVLASRYAESDFEELRLWRRELRALFKQYPGEDNFETWLFALEPAEQRRAFDRTWQGYARALEHVLPRAQEEHAVVQEALWFDRVRQEAAAFYFDHALAQSRGSNKVRMMLENAARTYGVTRVREAVRITAENFMEELEALGSRQAQVLRLQYALLEEIRQNLERDPVFYQALQQRVTKIVAAKQQKQIDEETALRRLREEALRLRAGALTRNDVSHLAPEAQAYWRVLVRYLAPPESEHERYEELAARLLAALEPDTKIVDWTLKEDWQREMRVKIKRLLREVNCPEDLLDPLTQAVMQLTRARFGS